MKFAEDTKLGGNIKAEEDCLKAEMEAHEGYHDRNGMKSNRTKSKVVGPTSGISV